MAALLSRKELSASSRTSQFIVERSCPVAMDRYNQNELRAVAETTFPFVIWVDLDGEVIDSTAYCNEKKWLVRKFVAEPIRYKFGFETNGDLHVCACMGRLIE